MKQLIIFLSCLSFILACNKRRDEVFHIKAINPVTGLPYAGLRWNIFATKTGNDGEKIVLEKEGILDGNGEAFISLKVKTNHTYNIGCNLPENNCYFNKSNITYAYQDPKKPDFIFEFAPCAQFKLSVINANCNGPTDKIEFRRTWNVDQVLLNYVTREGCDNFYGDYFGLPMGSYTYDWKVTRNGVTNSYDSTFYLNENQSFEFNLNY
ncbi:MAG: hypothetical protein KJ941_06960 [Bacteroidetes bacterium]|nr:hypothetical protein [Bacteroidota bacterium]